MATYALVRAIGRKKLEVLDTGNDLDALVAKGEKYKKKHPRTTVRIARFPIVRVVRRKPKKK